MEKNILINISMTNHKIGNQGGSSGRFIYPSLPWPSLRILLLVEIILVNEISFINWNTQFRILHNINYDSSSKDQLINHNIYYNEREYR